ncbi:MAG: hypothetical protein V7785_22330 [Bermanella sp.]
MKHYKITLLGLGIAILILLTSLVLDVDFFEQLVNLVLRLEQYEIDELIIPLIIFLIFAFVDIFKRNRINKVNTEKLKIYSAMMSSTQHILNNFLNQMQLFKLTAEDTPKFNPEVLALYDEIIDEASMQITALGNVHHIDEIAIQEAVAPKPKKK